MGVVFRAYDAALERDVALKVLAPVLAADAESRERFIRESRAAARIHHPSIIPVYAAGEAEGVLYLAMRFVPGGDLRSVLLREGPLSAARAVALLSPVASALDAAHAAGLVHRDVKLANILVDVAPGQPDCPYLSDFGIVKHPAASSRLTSTGHFLGTPDYAAPEQISGGPVRAQTDQYALACVAYTVLVGEPPFTREEPMSVLWAHVHESAPPVTARRPDLPPAVDGVLIRALAKLPDDRYPTCSDFLAELGAALSAALPPGTEPAAAASAGQGASPPSPPVPVPAGETVSVSPQGPVPTADAAPAVDAAHLAPRREPPSPSRSGSVLRSRPVIRAAAAAFAITAFAIAATAAAVTLLLKHSPGTPGAGTGARASVSGRPAKPASPSAPAVVTTPSPSGTPTVSRTHAATPTYAATRTHAATPTHAAAASPTGQTAPSEPAATSSPLRYSAQLLDTLALPGGQVPVSFGFIDNNSANAASIDIMAAGTAQSAYYAWNVSSLPPVTTTPPKSENGLAVFREAGNLVALYGTTYNTIQFKDFASKKIVCVAAAPAGTSVENFSVLPATVAAAVYYPQSFELAAAVSDGKIYIWRISRQA
jgi:serine/threonine-protein kinase